MRKSVLFLLDNPFTNDRRVYREAKTLVENGYVVTLVATRKEGLEKMELIDGIQVCRLFEQTIFDIKNKNAIPKAVAKIESLMENIDVIHAHDHTMLEVGTQLKKNNSSRILIYDSHELFSSWPLNVSNYNSLWIWLKSFVVRKLQIAREKRNSRWVDYVITVNESIASYLQKYFKLEKKPVVLRNIPEKLTTPVEKTDLLRTIFKIPLEKKILVFIGANIYAKTLNLEAVLEQFGNHPLYAMVFITASNINSRPIEELVHEKAYKNIFFHGLITPQEIPSYLASADVGLVPTWNKNDLSYWYALDNKLFEYMNAGIPILATAQPEYKLIVEEHACGICVNPDEKDAYMIGFERILTEYDVFAENCKIASQKLNWETEQLNLVELYRKFV